MPTDQVEMLTREMHDARRVIDSLPMHDGAIPEMIFKDFPEPASPVAPVVLKAMAWATYVMALGVLVLLARAVLSH
jgi:hypothetical protein